MSGTRAIHLELMSDMSDGLFLMGFRRFLLQHGKPKEIFLLQHGEPKEIISDNASQFKLASFVIENVRRQILSEKNVFSYAANDNIK